MHRFARSLCLTALMMVAPAAYAQETAPQADDGLSIGEPAGPRVGEPYVRDAFGDWALRCIKEEEGNTDPCTLYQLLLGADGAAVAEFNLFPLPAGGRVAAGATIVVPLETLLTEQLTIAVDGQNPRVYPFNFCNRAGCVARVGFTQGEVEEFKRGIASVVRIVPAAAPDQQVVLDVSLLGFTAGYETLAASL